jgi:elongation factor P hydroxylase
MHSDSDGSSDRQPDHAVDHRARHRTRPPGNETLFDPRQLERVFARCFEAAWRTRLEGGGAEPLYIPSHHLEAEPHRIVYREDYFASALHEVAHWCLAGAARRQLEDYGYWYRPDGRDADEQRAFESVEARPQALEWIFSEACGADFTLSADNLDGGGGPGDGFAAAVEQQKKKLEREGLPPRAERFRRALEREWAGGACPDRDVRGTVTDSSERP